MPWKSQTSIAQAQEIDKTDEITKVIDKIKLSTH
jgi:hypothetical protein